MPPDHPPPNGWIPLENRLYRRQNIYQNLPWKLQPKHLSSSLISLAPSAGPIAVIPDAGWGLSYPLAIYTLSGHLIKRFHHLREKKIPPSRAITLGWGIQDTLTIVYADCVVVRISSDAEFANFTSVPIQRRDQNEQLYDALVVASGDVVMRGTKGTIYKLSANDVLECEESVVKPPDLPVDRVSVSAIAVVKPEFSPHGSLEMIFISGSGAVTLIGPTGAYTMPGERNVSHVAVSPNGQYLAVVDETSGYLFVFTVDLRTEIARVNLVIELTALNVDNDSSGFMFDAKSIDDVSWVGNDSIGVLYREHLVLVGPHGGVALLPLGEKSVQGSVILASEIDGLRILSSTKVQFVQMVPEPVNAVFYSKQAPGYRLLKSSDNFSTDETATPTEALNRYRIMKDLRNSRDLLEGARSCTAAAYFEFDPKQQKNLLHAAAYGQRYAAVFSEGANSEENKQTSSVPLTKKRNDDRSRKDIDMVPTAIAVLRVLNAVSAPEAGIPVTKPQLDSLGLPGIVARLSRYGKFTLAIRMAIYGGITFHDILSEWAISAVHANVDESDEALTSFISDRFEVVGRAYTGIKIQGTRKSRALPYVKAAEAAFNAGRLKCAELLLRRETRPAPKVAMYLKMGREAPAIMASVASGDPELVLDALGSVLERKSIRETARLLKSLPPALSTRATDLFANHLKQIRDFNALRLVYHEVGRKREAALVEIHLADQLEDSRQHMIALEKTAQTIGRGYSKRSCHFEVQALQHATTVASNAIDVEKQAKLETGTLRYSNEGDLLARAILDIADPSRRRDVLARLRRELRVPDRRFFWVCLDSMAEAGDFASIETLSKSAGGDRPPPIGFTAFVDTCIKYHRDEEAAKYAMRIVDLRDRARALARCGHGREAADIASRLRNQPLLQEIQSLAGRHVAQIKLVTNNSH